MIRMLISHFAAACPSDDFLFFPKWYKYLQKMPDPNTGCSVPQIAHLSDVWLIVAAIIEIMLRIAALVAVIFIIYGGFSYVTSQGEPDETGKAKNTIVNALVGLAVAVTAAAIVSFIARSIHS